MAIKNTRLQTLVTEQESAKLLQLAKQDNRTVSGYIRRKLIQEIQDGAKWDYSSQALEVWETENLEQDEVRRVLNNKWLVEKKTPLWRYFYGTNDNWYA